MPRLLEYDIAAQTQLRLVVPDDMSEEDVLKLVTRKARDLLDACQPVIQVPGPARFDQEVWSASPPSWRAA